MQHICIVYILQRKIRANLLVRLYKCEYSFHLKHTTTFTNTDKLYLVLHCALKTLAYLLVSLAASDADEFFDAASIAKGFGVLHILGDDFVQCAADGSYCII